MALRNIDTNFFKSQFVRGLAHNTRMLYVYIICECSSSGIWVKDLPAASLYTGSEISDFDFENAFVRSGKAIEIVSGKYFFKDFIYHQYPKGLNANNTAHKNVISELMGYGLLNQDLSVKTLGDEKREALSRLAKEHE